MEYGIGVDLTASIASLIQCDEDGLHSFVPWVFYRHFQSDRNDRRAMSGLASQLLDLYTVNQENVEATNYGTDSVSKINLDPSLSSKRPHLKAFLTSYRTDLNSGHKLSFVMFK
jgi:hypothetical protein